MTHLGTNSPVRLLLTDAGMEISISFSPLITNKLQLDTELGQRKIKKIDLKLTRYELKEATLPYLFLLLLSKEEFLLLSPLDLLLIDPLFSLSSQ